MANGTVTVLQAADGDRLIDNEVVSVAGSSVYRQRVITYPPEEDTRLDYDTRTDGNPVYVGTAPIATATSSSLWRVLKLTYDSSSRLTRKQIAYGSWDNRTGLSW